MTRFLPVLLLLCLAYSGLHSQQPFPTYADSAVWHVLFQGMLSSHTYDYTFRSDTTMCGYNYSVIAFPSIDGNLKGYVRNESDRVYLRNSDSCQHKEYLMYDYSVVQGDTVYVGFELIIPTWTDTDTAGMRVDTVFYQSYNGVIRKTILLNHGTNVLPQSGFWGRYMYWVEGLGSLTHPFYPFGIFYDGYERYYNVLCTDSAGTEIYRNMFYNDCFITALDEGQARAPLQVWPNPARTSFWVELPAGTIEVVELYDLNGRSLQRWLGNGTGRLEINSDPTLPEGPYVIKVVHLNGVSTKRIILKE